MNHAQNSLFATYDVPSAAGQIGEFLKASALTVLLHRDIRKPPEHPESPMTNAEALSGILPAMARFVRGQADDDLTNYADHLGTLVTSYGNVKLNIPSEADVESLQRLLRALQTVATSRKCPLTERELIHNYEAAFRPFKKFVEAWGEQFRNTFAHHDDERQALRASEQWIAPKDEIDEVSRGLGVGPLAEEIAPHDQAASAARLGVEEADARMALIESLESGIAVIARHMQAEIDAAVQKARG